MVKYLVVIEKADRNYSAYSPDLPGCVATGKTKKAVEKAMRTAVAMHVRGLREDRRRLPRPQAFSEYMAVRES